MTGISDQTTSIEQTGRNIKLNIKKWKYPYDIKRRENITITKNTYKIEHLTYAYPSVKNLHQYVAYAKLTVEHIIVITCPKYIEARPI